MTSASCSDIGPRFCVVQLLKGRPATVTAPGQPYGPAAEYPWARAAAVEVTFQVDPGPYSPWVARLSIGSPCAVPNRFLNSRWERPPFQMRGVSVGTLAVARIRPVVVITTAAPLVAPRLPSACARWMAWASAL